MPKNILKKDTSFTAFAMISVWKSSVKPNLRYKKTKQTLLYQKTTDNKGINGSGLGEGIMCKNW